MLGGEAPLAEIYSIVVKIFSKNREAGERVITQLRPHCFIDSENDEEQDVDALTINRSLLLLCFHASKNGRDMKWLFTNMDPEKKGLLTYDEFSNAIRVILGLWITKDDCFAICKFLDEENT